MKIKIKDAVIPLVLINIAVFILQATLGSWFTEMFLLASQDVLSRPWILLTSMFLHGGTSHLLFNMYALFIFGPLIEQRIGVKRFVFIYFLSGIFAAIMSTFFYSRALGASGAIMGIIGVTIMLFPNLRVLLFFFIPMSLRTAGIIFALVDILGVFVPSGVANIAHLVGLGCGLVFGYYLIQKKKQFTKRFTKKSHNPKKRTIHHISAHNKNIEMSKDEIEDYIQHGRL